MRHKHANSGRPIYPVRREWEGQLVEIRRYSPQDGRSIAKGSETKITAIMPFFVVFRQLWADYNIRKVSQIFALEREKIQKNYLYLDPVQNLLQ